MKKLIIILTVLFLSLAFLHAAPGQYDDLKEFITSQTKIMEDTVANMEKATDETQVAAALTKFKDDLLASIPTLKAMVQKYPTLEALTQTPPEELKADVEKLNLSSQKMGPVMMSKMQQYANSEIVQKAVAELQAAGQQIQQAAAPAGTQPAETEPTPEKQEEQK